NRYALLDDLESKKHYGLILINIDSFKEINDFYGHDFGDKVLVALSRLLQEMSKPYPMKLYKMPSDEFALAITKKIDEESLEAIFKKILTLMSSHSYNIDNVSLYITYAIGVCIDETIDKALLTNADIALKTAKKQNANIVYFTDALQTKKDYQNNIIWSKKLKDAIGKNSFKLLYQPIYSASSGKIIKYEALVRMVDEDGSLISPFFFLQAAKKSRLYPAITKFVIDSIFEQLTKKPYLYSINISILDILNQDTMSYLFEKLSSSSDSDKLVFELLESEGVENYKEVSEFISKVKSFGSKIAIDDFGTGYSNFAHIIKLDVDILKIDGSLIKNIDTDTNAQTIVAAVIEFSKRLNLEVVAEFVHSKEVYEKCKELGIGYLQGYYLGEPKEL
ncbi:MAG: bifunctional diguanylate cyclase/phosphodiesterase, partial [Sulfurimonas sp.]